MATFVTLTIPVADIIGAPFDAKRTSVYIEADTPSSLIIVDGTSVRVGGRRENVGADGTLVLSNLVATNSADNPTNFGYRVTIVFSPKGAKAQQHITTSTFPLNANANLAAIEEAWDDITAPPSWRSTFRDEMEAIRDGAAAIVGPTDSTVEALVKNTGGVGPLTSSALSATYGRGVVDVRAFGAALDGTTDDAAAIQAALDTGLDVVIARLNGGPVLDVKIGSTLTLPYVNKGQRLTTIGARLLPSFVGDAVHLDGDLQQVQVLIEGSLQPGAGDFSEVAGVRIGSNSTGTYLAPGEWPFQPSVARTFIRGEFGAPFKGNGIIWENGPMVDFTQTYIADVTHDGIRAGGVAGMWDANHGLFVGTHVVRAGRYGYHIKRRVTDEFEDSRFNKFVEAKAYDCGVKDGGGVTTSGASFRIETNSNSGSVFSERGIMSLTGDSYGNHFEMEPFNAVSPLSEDVYGHEDFGQGNRLSGMSYFEHYETVNARYNRIEINARYAGTWTRMQTGALAYLDTIVGGGADAYVDYEPEPGFTRIDRFNGAIALPGDTERVIIADSATGILTVPAATTVAAGATWTSAAVEAASQYGNGFASMFAGNADLVVTITVTAAFEAKVTVRNLSGAGIDISNKLIRWTVLAYRT